jgi:hypothetical protein
MTAPTETPTARVARLSYFFPAHNEEANLESLVREALEALPALADRFEIIAVDDGSRDATPTIVDALTAANPGVVRAIHHPTNLGYGAATTRRTWATVPRCDPASVPLTTSSLPSPTVIASSTSPTWGGCSTGWPSLMRRTSSSATGSSVPTRRSARSTRARTGWPTASSSG